MQTPIKIGFAIPAYGNHLDVGHAAMWLGIGAALAASQDKFKLQFFATYHINGIELCRNVILHDALQAGCDWIWQLDADTYHASTGQSGEADAAGDAGVDFLQATIDAERYPKPVAIIGAPVRGRGISNPGVCVQVAEHIEVTTGKTTFRQATLEELQGKVTEIARIGGAATAFNLNWFRKHFEVAPWFVMKHDYGHGRPKNLLGEDYYICDEARNRGGTILCDGRFVPEHVDRRRLVGHKD